MKYPTSCSICNGRGLTGFRRTPDGPVHADVEACGWILEARRLPHVKGLIERARTVRFLSPFELRATTSGHVEVWIRRTLLGAFGPAGHASPQLAGIVSILRTLKHPGIAERAPAARACVD